MTLGERGGTTDSLDAGVALLEQHKASLAQSIREDILSFLEQYGEWHRNNLRVTVPADSKNAVGAVVNGLIRSGLIVETGERRKSADPASHSRKSNVYRLAGARGSQVDLGASAASSSGPGRAVGGIAPGLSGEMSVGASPSRVPADPPRLFEIPEPDDGPGHVDLDQRAA